MAESGNGTGTVAPPGYEFVGTGSLGPSLPGGQIVLPAGIPFSEQASIWYDKAGNTWYGAPDAKPASAGSYPRGEHAGASPSLTPAGNTVATFGVTPALAHDIAVYENIPAASRTAKQAAALATDLATARREAGGMVPLPASSAPAGTQVPDTVTPQAPAGAAPVGIDLTAAGAGVLTALEAINAGWSAAVGPIAQTAGDAVNNLQNNPQVVSQWAAKNVGTPAGKIAGTVTDAAGNVIGSAATGATPGVVAGTKAAVGPVVSGAVQTGGAAVGSALGGLANGIGSTLSGAGISGTGLLVGAGIILVAFLLLKEA